MSVVDGPVAGLLVQPETGYRDPVRLWFDGHDLLLAAEDDGTAASDPQTSTDRYAVDDLMLESLPDSGQPLCLAHAPSGRVIEIPSGPFAMTVRASARHLRTPAADARGCRTLFLFMLPIIVLYLLPIVGTLALVAVALWYGDCPG